MTIIYRDTVEGVEASELHGFFVGWPNPPEPGTHLRLLRQSGEIVLAIAENTGRSSGTTT